MYAHALLRAWLSVKHEAPALDMTLTEGLKFLPFPTSTVMHLSEGGEMYEWEDDCFDRPKGMAEAIQLLQDQS